MANQNKKSGTSRKCLILGVIVALIVGLVVGIPLYISHTQIVEGLQSRIDGLIESMPDVANPDLSDLSLVDVVEEERNFYVVRQSASGCGIDSPYTFSGAFNEDYIIVVQVKSTAALEASILEVVSPKIEQEWGLSHGTSRNTMAETATEISPGTTVLFEGFFAEVWRIGAIVNGDGQIVGTFGVRTGLNYDIRPTVARCEVPEDNDQSSDSTSAFGDFGYVEEPSTVRIGYSTENSDSTNRLLFEQAESDEEIDAATQFADANATNSDWEIVTREFDGVEMVLVPTGCFVIGSTRDQLEYLRTLRFGDPDHFVDELYGSEVCIDEPFWIDKYEVTNAEFEEFEGVAENESFRTNPERPRERITWNEATDFCEARGGYLPTEEQWEFAARGPDQLIFPWGNEFNSEYVAYSGNEFATVPQDKYIVGVSWVGAANMSGNVWEWTDSVYGLYGIEVSESDNPFYVIRGGSIFAEDGVHAANRGGSQRWNSLVGFRCARSVE